MLNTDYYKDFVLLVNKYCLPLHCESLFILIGLVRYEKDKKYNNKKRH